jgi:hypothetical protein
LKEKKKQNKRERKSGKYSCPVWSHSKFKTGCPDGFFSSTNSLQDNTRVTTAHGCLCSCKFVVLRERVGNNGGKQADVVDTTERFCTKMCIFSACSALKLSTNVTKPSALITVQRFRLSL